MVCARVALVGLLQSISLHVSAGSVFDSPAQSYGSWPVCLPRGILPLQRQNKNDYLMIKGSNAMGLNNLSRKIIIGDKYAI